MGGLCGVVTDRVPNRTPLRVGSAKRGDTRARWLFFAPHHGLLLLLLLLLQVLTNPALGTQASGVGDGASQKANRRRRNGEKTGGVAPFSSSSLLWQEGKKVDELSRGTSKAQEQGSAERAPNSALYRSKQLASGKRRSRGRSHRSAAARWAAAEKRERHHRHHREAKPPAAASFSRPDVSRRLMVAKGISQSFTPPRLLPAMASNDQRQAAASQQEEEAGNAAALTDIGTSSVTGNEKGTLDHEQHSSFFAATTERFQAALRAPGLYQLIISYLLTFILAGCLGKFIFHTLKADNRDEGIKFGAIVIVAWVGLGLVAFTSGAIKTKGGEGETLSVVQTIYLCLQILTTVGYGDLCTNTAFGYLFVSIYCVCAIMMIGGLISELTEYLMASTSKELKDGLTKVQGSIDAAVKATRTKSSLSLGSSPGNEDASDQKNTSKANAMLRRLPSGWNEIPENLSVSTETLEFAFGGFFGMVMVGTLFYALYPGEEMGFSEAFYMSCITLTTIGFGDIHPKTEIGRAFACVWMVLGISSAANMVSRVAEVFLTQKRNSRINKFNDEMLTEMDESGDGRVDRCEFLRYVLRRYDLVQKEELDMIMAQFDSLDRDGSGFLDQEDLKYFQKGPSAGTK